MIPAASCRGRAPGVALAAAAALLVWGAAPAAARQVETVGETLVGRLVDGQGRVVPDWPVVLHRITPAGEGEQLATVTTGPDGRFAVSWDPAQEGTYFVATRYDNALYVGHPFEAARPPPGEYTVVVGPGSGAVPLPGSEGGIFTPGVQGTAGPPSDFPIAAFGLVLLVAVAFVAAARASGGGRRWRKLAIELAELEEWYAARSTELSRAEQEEYRRRRAELWDRLRGAAGVA